MSPSCVEHHEPWECQPEHQCQLRLLLACLPCQGIECHLAGVLTTADGEVPVGASAPGHKASLQKQTWLLRLLGVAVLIGEHNSNRANAALEASGS